MDKELELPIILLPDEDLVSQRLAVDSQEARKVCQELNKDIPGVENWRGLAFRLNLDKRTYEHFQPSSTARSRSPTKTILDWLVVSKPETTLFDVMDALETIGRPDVNTLIERHFRGNMN